ncbi:MAG: transposase [Myxococcales bacterium]|nr:transposase [Myxococcales bacterium]
MNAKSSPGAGKPSRRRRAVHGQLSLRKPARDGSRRGGARPGSGPKPKPGLRPTPHRARTVHSAGHPVHVTLRVRDDVPSLRRPDLFAWVRHSIAATNQSECPRLGDRSFRIVEFSVQTNHVHLIIEAQDKRTLRSGITSLVTRAARAINKALGRQGRRVWSQRAFTRTLTVPREVRNALVYVLMNHAKHAARGQARSEHPRHKRHTRSTGLTTHVSALQGNNVGVDPCSSAPYFNGFVRSPDDEAHWHAATRQPSPVHAAQTWLLTTGWRRHGLLPRAAPFDRIA